MAVMGAVLMLPLCLVALGAVEFHHMTTIRSAVQTSLDSATLAAAKTGRRTPAELKSAGLPVFKTNLVQMGDVVTAVRDQDVNYRHNAGIVSADATVCIKTIISSMIGREKTCLKVVSEVARESVQLEVVLVLDNSGSMEEWSSGAGMRKIDALEQAAGRFLTTLEGMSNPTDPNAVRVGVVPFAGVVRVSPSDPDISPWLDRDGRSSVNRRADGTPLFMRWAAANNDNTVTVTNPRRLDLFAAMNIDWAGCLESRPSPWDVTDAAPSTSSPNSLFVPYFAPDEPDNVSGSPQDHSTWVSIGAPSPGHPGYFIYQNDYLDDHVGRLNPARQRDHYSAANADTLRSFQYLTDKYTSAAVDAGLQRRDPANRPTRFSRTGTAMGPNLWCSLDPITPLTSNFTFLRAAVNQMPTSGQTNIAAGLMWGWHVISPNAPFSDGKPYGERGLQKVVVLMTDGRNELVVGDAATAETSNVNRSAASSTGYLWHGRLGVAANGTGAEVTTALNTKVTAICNAMKQQNVAVYAVQLEQGAAADALLRDCAGASNFMNVTNASQLDAAFNAIAEKISSLRIAS
jgi:Flp pilus assembly protein TadG